jgi:hypothetical protein
MHHRNRSCLDLVEEKFLELSRNPDPVLVDGRSLGRGLPQRPIPLEELRVLVLKRQASKQVKDLVWSHLVQMTRVRADPWLLAAAGMMVPGLKRIAARLGPYYPGDSCDLDSEIVEAFLDTLAKTDADQPGLSTELYRAALRRGRRLCERERRQCCPAADPPEDTGCPCAGNPDLALARAVLDGVLTASQANLVSGVHLDCARRGEVARRTGMSRDRVRRELATAKRGLARYLVPA